MHTKVLVWVLAWLPALASVDLRSAESDAATDAERATPLVAQLGSDSYEKRNAAQRALSAMGLKAKSALLAAAESEDIEIRNRVTRLLAQLPVYQIQAKWIEALTEGRTQPLLGGTGTPPFAPITPVITDEREKQARKAKRPRDVFREEGKKDSAVDVALRWLAKSQEPDGHWDSVKHGAQQNADLEQTALALMAILSAGHTEKVGMYKDNVRRAVAWLKSRQQTDGSFVGLAHSGVDGIPHALSTLALLEAASMAYIPTTLTSAKLGVGYMLNTHHKADDAAHMGVGRVAATNDTDLLTTALYALLELSGRAALSAQLEGRFDGATELLAQTRDAKTGLYAFRPGGRPNARATLAACMIRKALANVTDEELLPTLTRALKEYDGWMAEGRDPFFNFLAAMLAFTQGGDTWKGFSGDMKKALFESQRFIDKWDGSWDPFGARPGMGRVATTALNTLCLTIYYRYLPMHRWKPRRPPPAMGKPDGR